MSSSPSTHSRYSISIRMSMHFWAWYSEEGEATKRKKNIYPRKTEGFSHPSQGVPSPQPGAGPAGGASHFPQSPLAPGRLTPGSPTAPSTCRPRVSEGEGAAWFLCEMTPGGPPAGLRTRRKLPGQRYSL